MITQSKLKELFTYSPETGLFCRLFSRGGEQFGSEAGSLHPSGYVYITIDYKKYFAHRLAWLYVHGVMPEFAIDHVNRERSDNRISNLREATALENQQNLPKRIDNSSGAIGVNWHKQSKKWRAEIRFMGKKIHLGLHGSFDDAVAARANAKAKYHTFHPEDDNVTLSKETPDNRNHNSRD